MNLEDVLLRDDRANQPAATDVAEGTLYYVTDESVTEQSRGGVWVDYSDSGAAGIDQLTGDVTAGPGSGSQAATVKAAIRTTTIGITIDGAGSAITTGIKGYRSFPVAATILGWRLLADIAGDVEFDVFKDPFASYPPTTSIVAAAPPEMTGVDSAEDTTLTGWTTSVSAGDVFGFEVISAATLSRVTLELTLRIN